MKFEGREIKRVVVYDYDSTMFYTPADTPENRELYFIKKGEPYPYDGWYGRAESLDTDVFFVDINQYIYKKYLEDKKDPHTLVVLMTGRREKLAPACKNIINQYGLEFDIEKYAYSSKKHPYHGTLGFKLYEMQKLYDKYKPDEFIIYDDRRDHHKHFVELTNEMMKDGTNTFVELVNS